MVSRNYFRRIQKLFRRIQKLFRCIQKLFSLYSETISVVFRNYFRGIQKLCSSYSVKFVEVGWGGAGAISIGG